MNTIVAENVSHLLVDSPYVGYDVRPHFTQMDKKPIKLKLFFMISTEDKKLNLVYIDVPPAFPVFKVRGLVNYLEERLNEIYGKAKRANFVYTAPENSSEYSLMFDLPIHGVRYV